MATEANAIKYRRGKWSQAGIPHKGWTCIETDDLGSENMQTCQMCESSEIRYAHSMRHPDYKETLVVGVVCAGNMESDLVRAKDRERAFKKRLADRERWPRTKWKTSKNGNPWRNHEGYNCVLKEWPQGWQILLRPLPDGEVIPWKKRYATEDEAKLAAYDYIKANPITRDDEEDYY